MNNGNHMALFSASELRSSRMRLCMWTRWLAIGPVKGKIKGEPSRSSTMAPVGRNGIQNKQLLLLFTLFLVLFVINKNRPLKIAKTRPLDMKNTHIIRLAISLVRSKLTQKKKNFIYIYQGRNSAQYLYWWCHKQGRLVQQNLSNLYTSWANLD